MNKKGLNEYRKIKAIDGIDLGSAFLKKKLADRVIASQRCLLLPV
jgi:hypothetical protein